AELDERDKHLMTILHDTALSHYVDEAKTVLIEANASICPLCGQSLDSQKLADLEAQIKRVLNKDVEDYKLELTNVRNRFQTIAAPAPNLPMDSYAADIYAYNDAVTKVNHTLKEVCDRLEAKTNNLFNSEKPLDVDAIGEYYKVLGQRCEALSKGVEAFNQTIAKKKVLVGKLREKNKILAYLENQSQFVSYTETKKEVRDAGEKIKSLESQLRDTQKQIKDLESQRRQTQITLQFINQCIRSILFDPDRLVLEQADGKFALKSRGKDVAPGAVSTGERNIIGLAYFFASLFKDTSEENRYRQPYLVVIDDPITSYDSDNRMGVMAFLKEQLTELLLKTEGSKVMVMSHDQRTIDLLVSMGYNVEIKLLYKENKHPSDEEKNIKIKVFELHRRRMVGYSEKSKSEYSQMLHLLYKFAQDEETDRIEYVGIGNTIRRVLESFSMMMLNTSDYTRLVDNTHLRLSVRGYDSGEIRRVYKRYLSRIFLNPESHSSVNIAQDNYDSAFTRESIQTLARYTLTFIYTVNDQHLWTSLKDEFKDWKQDLLDWRQKLVLDGLSYHVAPLS
ncbi:MAG: AAA family ATPase, partial [Bacteroidaceae bacterium]|nr:AAA family ATPase [Bacteroidaceae bacterium]